MTIIEGVGNEVTQFFFIVICGIIALLAWWSTGQRQNRYRTAVILERNVRNVYRDIPSMLRRGQTLPRTMLIVHRYSRNPDPVLEQSRVQAEQIDNNTETPESTSQSSLIQDTEMNNIVNAMDSDIRNRRLVFFSNRNDNNSDNGAPTDSTSTSAGICDSEKISQDENIKVNQNDESLNNKNIEESNVEASKEDDKSNLNDYDSSDNIRIRLKYLNDDLKLVDGSLHEPLGDFKRRHFKEELSSHKLIRLIFNGQVLQRENATLQSCGLFDNCVVHCLVHQPRTPQQLVEAQQQLVPSISLPSNNINNNHNVDNRNGNQASRTERGNQEERDWDLSHVLFTMLASLLSIAWYVHIRFSSFFGVAASLAMLGLTGIYVVAVMCVYFPETQPAPSISALNTEASDNPEGNRAN